MASYLVSGFFFICLSLHSVVYGVQGRELQGLHHNGSTVTTTQKEVFAHTKALVENGSSQSNLLFKPYASGYHPLDGRSRTQHWATYRTQQGDFYGIKATINVWKPVIQYDQTSSAEIWVSNDGGGPRGNLNTVQAGWHVHPSLYDDHDTHFFIYWTKDGYQKTGCYNLDCPGFVLTNSSRLVPGIRLRPESEYDGTQYYITLKIYKDPQTGDWLLFEGQGDAPNFIGYWPKSLFTNLANSASQIELGGSVAFYHPDPSPIMGSGHLPIEGEGRAASFKNVQYVNDKGDLKNPTGYEAEYEDKDECYEVGPFLDSGLHGHSDRWVFRFGGRGGCN